MPGIPVLVGEKSGAIKGDVSYYTGRILAPKELAAPDGTILPHELIAHAKTKGLCFVGAALDDAPAQTETAGAAHLLTRGSC